MQIIDVLNEMGGIRSIARELGLPEADAAKGAEALTPTILEGFERQSQSETSTETGFGSLLGGLGGARLLEEVLAPHPTDVSRGNEILGQILGSKDVSRKVAQSAASRSGLTPDVLKRMLPMLAMLVAGYLAKQREVNAP